MRILFLTVLICGIAFSADPIGIQQTLSLLAPPAAAGGGGSLTATALAGSSDTANNPATTASVAPTSGSMLYAVIGYAKAGGGTTVAADSVSITGGMSSWAELGKAGVDASGRRAIIVMRGTGTASSGTLSITVNVSGGTWTETFWSIIEVAGHNSGDPDDASVGDQDWTVGATSGASGDVGTPDTGDLILSAFIHETDEAVSITGFSALSSLVGGSDVRTLHTGYHATDDTPAATWSTSSGWAGIGWIVNKAP